MHCYPVAARNPRGNINSHIFMVKLPHQRKQQ